MKMKSFLSTLFCCNIIETELLFTAPSNFAISPICQIILAMRLTPLSGSDIRLQFFHDPIWAQNLIQIYLIWFWPGYFCCRAMKKGFNVEQTMKRGNTSALMQCVRENWLAVESHYYYCELNYLILIGWLFCADKINNELWWGKYSSLSLYIYIQYLSTGTFCAFKAYVFCNHVRTQVTIILLSHDYRGG